MLWAMTGKTVLITGATAGIGRVTARELAAAGAQILLVARDRRKAEETREWIATRTGSTAVELIIADLSILSQVRSVAQQAGSRPGASMSWSTTWGQFLIGAWSRLTASK